MQLNDAPPECHPNLHSALRTSLLSGSQAGCVAGRRLYWTLALSLGAWKLHLHPLLSLTPTLTSKPPSPLCKEAPPPPSSNLFPIPVASVLPLPNTCFSLPYRQRPHIPRLGKRAAFHAALSSGTTHCHSLAQPDFTELAKPWPRQATSSPCAALNPVGNSQTCSPG